MTSPNGFFTPPTAVTARPAVLPGMLFVLGSILFLAGGSMHPKINDALGTLGTPQFYQGFIDHVSMSAHWETFHHLILIGPILWALAAAGVDAILPRAGAQVWSMTRTALAIGATAWIVAFALDGFNAPAFARAIAATRDAAIIQDKLFEFSTSQRLVAYLGRVSWTMMSLAFAAYGAGLLFGERRTAWRIILGGTGVLLGLWTIFEVARGDFSPGPFTSHFWTPTALATGIWIWAFGVTVARARALSTQRVD